MRHSMLAVGEFVANDEPVSQRFRRGKRMLEIDARLAHPV